MIGTQKSRPPRVGKVCVSEKPLFLVAHYRSGGELAELRQAFQAGSFGVASAANAAGTGDHGGSCQGDECQGADHVGSVFWLVNKRED